MNGVISVLLASLNGMSNMTVYLDIDIGCTDCPAPLLMRLVEAVLSVGIVQCQMLVTLFENQPTNGFLSFFF